MSWRIELEVFNGPMDLLLYLVSKEEVDISEVSVARVVDQYMEYLRKLQELNVDVTSDFIVMASTLMLIKSRMLLPTEEIDLEEEIDPQDELIKHLLEYKKFKVLSRALRERAERRARLFGRPRRAAAAREEEVPLEEVDLWDLLRAFARIVRETGLDRSLQVIHADKPIRIYIAAVLDTLRARKRVCFDEIFHEKRNREDAVCFFIGILELAKRKLIQVLQDENTGEIHLSLAMEEERLEAIKVDGVYRLDKLLVDGMEEGGDGLEAAAAAMEETVAGGEGGASGMESGLPEMFSPPLFSHPSERRKRPAPGGEDGSEAAESGA